MKKGSRLAALLLAAALVTAMTAGCEMLDRIKAELPLNDEINERQENDAQGGANAAESGVEGISNILSVGIIDFDTFNPLMTVSQTVRECMEFVYEPLFDVDEKLRPQPVLAESYTVSPDGRTIDITLRQGVTWQDGTVFNAYDAAYTIKQIRSGITNYTENLANVADHKATGDYSLRLTLNFPVPDFVSLLNFPIVKSQSEVALNPNYVPVGTGAYRYVSQPATGKMRFDAYDGYHGGRAQIDAVDVTIVPDMARYESMFEASEIDLITGSTVDLSEYTPRGSAKSNEYITNKLTYAGFNTRSAVLGSAATRIGLSKLIDKDGIVNSTIYSRGVAVDVPVNPSSLFYYDTNTRFKRDEQYALSMLGNDGWGSNEDGDYVRTVGRNKQKLSLDILADDDSTDGTAVAEKIAKDFSELGIKATVTAVNNEKYNAKIASGDYDMMIGETELPPNLDLTELVSSAGNPFSYANTDLDTIIGQMGMTRDEEQLKALYKSMGDTILSDMPFCPLYFRKGSVISGTKLKTEVVPSVTRRYRNVQTWSVR